MVGFSMYTKNSLCHLVLDGLLWNVGIVGSISLWITFRIFSWKPPVSLTLKKCYFYFCESFLEYKHRVYFNARKEPLEGLTRHKMFWKKHFKWWSFIKRWSKNYQSIITIYSSLIFLIMGFLGGWIFTFWWQK